MALHDDLLAQADALAHAEIGKPKQASLRRAVSAAYYAVFHLLVDQSSRFLIAGKRDALRQQLARCYDHGQMRKAAQVFAAPSATSPWRSILSSPPSAPLVDVASAFIGLQEARHDADYDLSRTFARTEAEALIARTHTAFKSWEAIAGTDEANAFLVALLVRGRT